MRMAELSAESGVPVATVKYYLREGLLPPGERTSPNQARYSPAHVQRLRLIKALTDVGGLPLASVGAVLSAIDEDRTPHETMGVVQEELAGEPPQVSEEAAEWASKLLQELAHRYGWKWHGAEDRTVANLIAALATAKELGHEKLAERLDEYFELALRVAELDVEVVTGLTSFDKIIEAGLIATVLGDRIFTGLRHLAQEYVSREVLGRAP
ncbi:MerR family transcriptional regulator [Amycolatopsis sp. SID8362]|uniref:MerR family transcriptional regulator n=1 Tax=Amycolatopsis sp. SID8362 TaxID=2690346 RepID=UPI001367B2A0|nr:MerR family transcriptional regulator [Amycolatopsis sp. SID8362]NBH03862.1 MerR family transcriptional regulator [Amycolatopsis sp. SID8362]NED40562.1 MerR family transcriptional regulator [Amycolatopsis sp. SID8362]